MIKEGSNVIWNGRKDSGDVGFLNIMKNFLTSKKVHTISVIGNKYKGYCKLEGDNANIYDLNWFDLVDYEWKPTKGEFLRFSNDKDFKNSVNRAFYSYDKDLSHPYLVNLYGTISNYKFCKQIESIYKPYTEFNIEWIGKKLYFDSDSENEWEIVGYQNSGVLLYCNFGDDGESIYSIFSFEQLVNDCTLDGKPFGEEIKQDDEKF